MENKKKQCITVIRWRNYGLYAWENKREDGSIWLNYEIQRNLYLGKDAQGKKSYSNQSLSLTKLEDLCYLKTTVKFLMARNNNKPIYKYSFVGYKVIDENKKKAWKDAEKPTKEEMKESLKITHLFRTYKDKEGKEQETKHLIANSSELDITLCFIEYCISKIESIYDGERRQRNASNYKDTVDYSATEPKGEFVDEKLDDEIPF